jgi:TorA maturation chaperone TorD
MEFNNDYDIERAELYRLFANLFMIEPSADMIAQMKDIFQMESEDSLQDISADFAHIFLGPDKHLPPYESLYNYPLGEKPGLWRKAAEDVQAFYRASGLMMSDELNLIPDHLSAELFFMSYLIENGLIEQQKRFLEEHPMKWIPEYCDEMHKQANTDFYKEVANLLKEFISSDYEELNETAP